MKQTLLPPIALALSALPATSDQGVSQDQLSALIAGNTLYVTIPAGAPGAPDGRVAPIHYGTDGSAAALLPVGLKLVGTWAMGDAGYCIDWDNGPKNSCSTLERTAASYIIKDVSTGDPRGEVFSIAMGNPENL